MVEEATLGGAAILVIGATILYQARQFKSIRLSHTDQKHIHRIVKKIINFILMRVNRKGTKW